MPYATPPPTIYDAANLQLMQRWADPLLRAQDIQREELARQQALQEQGARIFNQQNFQREQQNAMIQGYRENDRLRSDVVQKSRDADNTLRRDQASKNFSSIHKQLESVSGQLEAAVQDAESERVNRIRRLARQQAPTLVKGKFDETIPEHAAVVADLELKLTKELPSDPVKQSRVKELYWQQQQLSRASSLLLKMGADVSPLFNTQEAGERIFRQPASTAPPLPVLEQRNSASTDELSGPPPPPGWIGAEGPKNQDTEGLLPDLYRKAKSILGQFGSSMERDFVRPAAAAANNAGTSVFGGNYIPLDGQAIYTPEERAARAASFFAPGNGIPEQPVFANGYPAFLQHGIPGPLPDRYVRSMLTPEEIAMRAASMFTRR